MSRGRGKMPPPPPEPETDSDEVIEDEEFEEDEEARFEEMIAEVMELPVMHRRRMYALYALLDDARALKKGFREETAALDQALLVALNELFDKRTAITQGTVEVSAADVQRGISAKATSTVEEIPSDDEEKKPAKKSVKVVTPADQKNQEELANANGVPNFWLTAFKNHEMIENMISERDEEVLKHLKDVRLSYINGKPHEGFVIDFFFEKNDFFKNEKLTKTYIMDTAEEEDEMLDRAEGTVIEWFSPQKNVTVEIKNKKQRHKSGKGVRVVQKEEKVPSFFRFFDPPKDEEDEEDDMYDPEEALEMDYEVGTALRYSVIPRATYYYTGEAVEAIAASLASMGINGDGDEEDEEEEDEEEEDEAPPQLIRGRGGAQGRGGRGQGPSAPAPKPGGKDCKQQ